MYLVLSLLTGLPEFMAYRRGNLPTRTERRFSEEFLQANVGKVVTVYLTFENNPRWPAKSVTGTLRNVGRDYFVIRDRQTGKDNMFLNINVDYFVFENQPATLLGDER